MRLALGHQQPSILHSWAEVKEQQINMESWPHRWSQSGHRGEGPDALDHPFKHSNDGLDPRCDGVMM